MSVREFNSVGAENIFWVNPPLPLMLFPNYVSGSQPDSHFNETQIFLKIKHDLMRLVLCYGRVLRFFKTPQCFDQITTWTYVLINNFFFLLSYNSLTKRNGSFFSTIYDFLQILFFIIVKLHVIYILIVQKAIKILIKQ